MNEKTWEEFRESGLLWMLNRSLHIFGWAIVLVQEADGSISRAYPARVNYRGFSREAEESGFERITKYMKDNISSLEADIKE
jgi:hypothetical protein